MIRLVSFEMSPRLWFIHSLTKHYSSYSLCVKATWDACQLVCTDTLAEHHYLLHYQLQLEYVPPENQHTLSFSHRKVASYKETQSQSSYELAKDLSPSYKSLLCNQVPPKLCKYSYLFGACYKASMQCSC